MSVRDLRITDSTLRDGSHAMCHRFTEEQVRGVVSVLDSAGVEVIEVSHGDGLGGSSFNYGFSAMDDIELVRAAVQEAKSAKIAVLLLPGLGTVADLGRAHDAGASVARIATHCTEADISAEHFSAARELGMETVGFLMLAHRIEPAALAAQARIMVDAGAQCVYVVDSAGAMVLSGAQARVLALIDEIGHQAEVGFHGHQNLSLGVANSVLAYQAGAKQVDGALCALGAGAGNAPTEVLVATFERLGIQTGVDVHGVLAAAEEVVKPFIHRLPWMDRSSIVQGYAGVYSSFLLHAERAAERYGVPAHEILQRVGEAGYVGGQEDMIIDVALQLQQAANERAGADRGRRTRPTGPGAPHILQLGGGADMSEITLPVARLGSIAQTALVRAGATPENAERQIAVLLAAECSAVPSHGLLRLPRLVHRIRAGVLDPATLGSYVWESAAVLAVDGMTGFGPVIADETLKRLVARAKDVGIAYAHVKRANHLGMLAYYGEWVASRGLALLATTSSEALVHPWGGIVPMVGTNPLAIAVPTATRPLVADLATSQVSAGKLRDYRARGMALEDGWALDIEGRPTTDPQRAIEGSLTPFGQAKGYALGLALGALVGALSDTSFGQEVTGTLSDAEPTTKGDLFIVVKPAPGTAQRLAGYLDAVRASPAQAADQPVRVPGDGARQRAKRSEQTGITLPERLWKEISQLAGTTEESGNA